MTEPLTLGTVPYLNAEPLLHGLAGRDDVRVRAAAPSALGEMLRRGEVDAALVPSVEYFRLSAEGGERDRGRRATRLVALDVAAIGSRGPVGSVRLFGYTEVKAVRRVHLDPASRTSNALARLLMVRQMGLSPHFAMPGEGRPGARAPDAEVVIGDRALRPPPEGVRWVVDLGEAWDRLVHLPFVYAFWAARAGTDLERLRGLLAEARDAGLAAREAIAQAAAERLGLPVDRLRRYLLHQVRYTFGASERKGLRAFARMAAEEGLVPDWSRLRMAEAGG